MEQKDIETRCWICKRTESELIEFFGELGKFEIVESTSTLAGIPVCGACRDILIGLMLDSGFGLDEGEVVTIVRRLIKNGFDNIKLE